MEILVSRILGLVILSVSMGIIFVSFAGASGYLSPFSIVEESIVGGMRPPPVMLASAAHTSLNISAQGATEYKS